MPICRALLLSFVLAATRATAQTPASATDDGFGVSAGYSWASPQQWGLIQNRHVSLVEGRIERQLARGGRVSLVHTVQVPLALVARKSRRAAEVCWPEDPSVCMKDTSSTAEVGIGVVPLGLKLLLGPSTGTRFFVDAGGGVSAFTGNVPTVGARRFNFLAEAGVGVEFAAPGRRHVVLGYRYMHLSNADTAPSNPGLDANLVYLGLTYRSAAR